MINMLLHTYPPLKRIAKKYKLKSKSKPQITLGLQKSISVKNKLLVNFINKKDPTLKEEFHTNYKKQKFTLHPYEQKRSKQAYYDTYFETNWNIKVIYCKVINQVEMAKFFRFDHINSFFFLVCSLKYYPASPMDKLFPVYSISSKICSNVHI